MRRAATAYRPHGQPAPIRAVGAGPRPLAAAVLHGGAAWVMAVDRAPNVLLLTVLAADGDDTETVVLRPAHPGARWRLAAALQTHLAAARARRRGTALVEALAQGGRTVDAWSAALARLTTGVQGYREGPGVSPEALWLMAPTQNATTGSPAARYSISTRACFCSS